MIRDILQLPLRAARTLVKLYRDHWFATPAGIISAIISTVVTAAAMIAISRITHGSLSYGSAIAANAIIGPLMAYILYLVSYYLQMYLIERRTLLAADGSINADKLRDWVRGAKFDYIAHLPSDAYLISLAGIAQAVLERSGTPIFWAVIATQLMDDVITFLKEPALWGGSKLIVNWEKQRSAAGQSINLDDSPRRQGQI